ncbi:MAG: CgeB family protein [Sulfuricaulis sp.]
MKILCAFGKYNYGNPGRGEGYEYSNFIPALRRLGHEVTHFDTWSRDRYSSFADLNLEFLKTVEHENPDLIFCVLMHYELWLETLGIVRRRCPAVLVNWSTDDSWKYTQFSRFVAPVFHVFATTYSEAVQKSKEAGLLNFRLTQWAANAEKLLPPLPFSQCRYPVSFVGSAYGNRHRWIADLKKRGITVACFGHGWPHGPVSTTDVARIIRESVISLNFADSGLVLDGYILRRSRQIKARIFEVPGSGGFLLAEHADNLASFYLPQKEIAVFDGIDDLAGKIKYFLAHLEERDNIAAAGYVRTRADHTYDLRFNDLLETVMHVRQVHDPRHVASTAVSCRIDFSTFATLAKAHEAGWLLKIFRLCLLVPCVILFGSKRGSRAARRLLFEISWRLLGTRTYSASGLPGRLFYRES